MTKRERITIRAKEILASCPEGIRFSELVKRLRESFPDEAEGNLTGSVWNLDARFPDEICKPSKGLFRLTRFSNDPRPPLPPKKERMREVKTMSSPTEAIGTVRTSIAQYNMSPAGNMKEQVEKYVQDVKHRYESCRDNEAATKQRLIVPLFAVLGYDMANPAECSPEDKAEFGKGRSKQPVDWTFSVNGFLAFLVEAKAVGKNIGHYDEQLGDYYAKQKGKVKLGILTTGVRWRFFTDLDHENVMDNEPFLEWDVLNGAIPYDLLTILQREKFKPELIKTFAKEKRGQRLLVKELTRLLEPSSEFVKLAIQNLEELGERKLTATVIEEWKPILVRAIREWAERQRLTAVLEGQQFAVDPSKLVGKPEDVAKVEPGEPSANETVYRLWVEDNSISPEECLERVGNRVKLASIKWWIHQWKLGKHLPRCAKKGKPSGDGEFIEFWEPIRREGLFKGKPADGAWISKGCRGIWLHLNVHNHTCSVDVRFSGEDMRERRSKAVELFRSKYPHELRESEKCAYIRFPVLDKGIKDRAHWLEIREKLSLLGANIYKALSESDV